MAVSFKNIVPPIEVPIAQSAVYTANAVKGIIDKCTVTNTSSVNVSFSLNLVPSSGTAASDNLIIDSVTIEPDETYMCPESIGHVIEAGGFISVKASIASSLTLRISGREIS